MLILNIDDHLLSGLYPFDPISAALVDEIIFLLEDILGLMGPSVNISDPEAKKAARLAVC